MGASASRRGLTRPLPGHFPRKRTAREGSHILSVQGFAPGSKSNENKKAKVLSTLKEAKERGANHLKSPTAALAKALEGLEQREKVPS